MNNKMTWSVKKGTDTFNHVCKVVEDYGNKATFKVHGVKWKIANIRPQGENSILLYLEL